MRIAIIVLMIFGITMLTEAYVSRHWGRPELSIGTFPTFPGHGPFNPRPRWPEAYGRGRRSAAYIDDYPRQERQAYDSRSDSWFESE